MELIDPDSLSPTVVSPVLPDETGTRVATIRHRAEAPSELDQRLGEQGYDLVAELLPVNPREV